MVRIDFFGLGEMGYAIAGHLARAGHALTPHDPDAQRMAQWREEFGDISQGAAAQIVITCVSDLAALKGLVAAPDGIAARLGQGSLWVDHTTTSPQAAREFATLAAARGAIFIDAPMSGGVEGAQTAELTLFAGGAESSIARARPLLSAYCNHLVHAGATGCGQATKLAHQLAIAGTVLGLQAALSYGGSQKLPAANVLAALKQGTARSVQLNQHAAKMGGAEFDFAQGFAWLAKDLAALAEGTPALPALLRDLLHAPPKKDQAP
jgi:3-hydroxyisobutyrate dehydrogenase